MVVSVNKLKYKLIVDKDEDVIKVRLCQLLCIKGHGDGFARQIENAGDSKCISKLYTLCIHILVNQRAFCPLILIMRNIRKDY